ncbi:hypothetical protein E3Q00_00960 [Wallemia mellicola]|nr:hypothetical protein E3Q00_00960 [Wallemia mellicola]
MYLISRSIDPLLGVFTGFLSFYLNETHPKTYREEPDRLISLIKWKLDQRRLPTQNDDNNDSDLNDLIQQFNNTK